MVDGAGSVILAVTRVVVRKKSNSSSASGCVRRIGAVAYGAVNSTSSPWSSRNLSSAGRIFRPRGALHKPAPIGPAPELAVGHDRKPRLLLHAHSVADAFVLDAREGVVCDLSPRVTSESLTQCAAAGAGCRRDRRETAGGRGGECSGSFSVQRPGCGAMADHVAMVKSKGGGKQMFQGTLVTRMLGGAGAAFFAAYLVPAAHAQDAYVIGVTGAMTGPPASTNAPPIEGLRLYVDRLNRRAASRGGRSSSTSSMTRRSLPRPRPTRSGSSPRTMSAC